MSGFEELFDQAKWIAATDADVCPILRQSFMLDRVPCDVFLNIIGFGGYSVFLNGKPVTEEVFLPLNTDFEKRETPRGEVTAHRILCDSYSVAHLCRKGKNTVAVLLGAGWYTGVAKEKPFGTKKLCFRLFEQESGATLAVSDLCAKWMPSFVREVTFDRGETQDFSVWDDAMLGTDFDDGNWNGVCEASCPDSRYMLSDCPRDRVIETITPVLISKDAGGALYDAGINLSGYPVLRAKEGDVSVRFSEVLDGEGTLSVKHGHKQYLAYHLAGKEQLLYPRFAWIGFRYFYVEGDAEVVSVQKTHADIAVDSEFSSDNETLNWIWRTYLNTQLCNIHNGIPSDCPHAERRGYTGDGQLTCRAAMRTLDARSFYRKWIDDIADCQDRVSGHVQYTAPYSRCGGGPGGWGCAIVIVLYEYWKFYGDDTPIREMFDGMLAYFDFLEAHSKNSLVTDDIEGAWCLGEWCTPDDVILPAPFVNNYFYVKGMTMAIEIARHVGRAEVIPMLEARIEERKQAIVAAYYNRWDGNFVGNKQGANAFALDIGLGDERTRENFLKHYERETYYDTGIFGTDIVTRLLFAYGRGDLAVRLLTADEPHGFGLWRRDGATTFWEYWDYYEDIRTRSYNHPMFGAAVAYFFDYLLGVTNQEGCVGYDRIEIKPVITDRLSRVHGSMTTKNGRVEVSYEREGDVLHLSVGVPEHTEASIVLPDGSAYAVTAGNHAYTVSLPVDLV